MNFTFYKFLTPLIILLFSITGTKESSAQRFMIGYGVSICTDMVTVAFTDNYIYKINPRAGINVLTASIEMKYNLYEFDENMALSISASPCFGIGDPLDNSGFGNIRVPIYAQLDFGKLSTFTSTNKVGVGFGLGYQFESYNLLGDIDKISFGTVAARVGLRFFNITELAFKMGFPKLMPDPSSYQRSSDESYYDREAYVASYHLSLIFYLRY